MKAVELRYKSEVSDYPIKDIKDLNIYSEYFIVPKEGKKNISILRYIDSIRKWYIISLDSFCTHELKFTTKELCEDYHVFCIPEYVGGSDGIFANDVESDKSRKELLLYLINKYWC